MIPGTGEPARRPGGVVRLLLLALVAAGFFAVFAVGFPPGARDRLPVLALALGLALFTAYSPGRGPLVFCFLFPLAGLGDRLFGGRLETIVRHIEHVINIAGEDAVSLGSDWDGSIVTPRDMPSVLELPRLTQALVDRKWSEARIRKVLGLNFIRVVQSVRG